MAVPLVTPEEMAAILDWPPTADTTELVQPCDAADKVVRNYLDPTIDHDLHPNDREAAMAVAVQIYSSRKAPGGQMQANNFTPMMVPHLLGPGLTTRVMGLISPCRKYGGLVVG
jgi:hypothetical protein